MKTLVLYYSYTGNTKRIALELAAKEGADSAEILDARRPGKFRAYTAGIFAVIKGKAWPMQPLDVDWSAYDRIILCAPVWASNPPPVVISALALLPEGKSVDVKLVSASGKNECKERLEGILSGRGCTLIGIEDIKVGR
ncbi:MAG: hypothetical protein FWE69_02775 [Clostridiales bacterium]|nr:hypothetical protein [Clostridiales bacterium]